jgi:hypothetical protein
LNSPGRLEVRFKWRRLWHRAEVDAGGSVLVERWAPVTDDNLDAREVVHVGSGRWNATTGQIEDHDLNAELSRAASTEIGDHLRGP